MFYYFNIYCICTNYSIVSQVTKPYSRYYYFHFAADGIEHESYHTHARRIEMSSLYVYAIPLHQETHNILIRRKIDLMTTRKLLFKVPVISELESLNDFDRGK